MGLRRLAAERDRSGTAATSKVAVGTFSTWLALVVVGKLLTSLPVPFQVLARRAKALVSSALLTSQVQERAHHAVSVFRVATS